MASARVSIPRCAITPLPIARQYGNAGWRGQRWHQKAPGHRETLSLSESCPQPSSISAYSLAAGEPCHERTFDGHATAAGEGLLEHTFGKLRAATLSREFLRRTGVAEGAPAILAPIVSTSPEDADSGLEPLCSRIFTATYTTIFPIPEKT